jgi:Xaa-Pro aminopeptidase
LRALFSKNIRTFYIQKQLQNKNIKNVRNFIKKYTSNYKLEDVGAISDKLRLIKEPEEIQLIKKAIGITYKAYIEVLTNIHPGQKEYEIEALITKVFIENGANAHAYDPIIASGANACFLHYTKNNKLMQENELVLMDFGAEYANYAADLSRTIPVNGKFSKEHKEIYLAVLDVQNELKKEYIPGNTIKNINEKAVKLMQQKMIDLNLFSKKDIEKQDSAAPLYKKYFMHGTAHFMGLDVHDSGTKLTVLEPGMILTCEPGIYINEQNVGIRIENDILITENTPIDLMKDFPVTPNEIESFI